jgi:hypothetical protein
MNVSAIGYLSSISLSEKLSLSSQLFSTILNILLHILYLSLLHDGRSGVYLPTYIVDYSIT